MKGLFSALQAVKMLPFFAILGLNSTAYGAPSVPKELLNSSLVYCTSVSGFTFNPQKADIGTNMNVITDQIYDKLFEFDTDNGGVKPMLAERYTISDDGKVITLFLRKKVAFHATPWFSPSRTLNAEDVVFSLNRIIGNVSELPALDFGESEQGKFQRNQFYAYQYKANLADYPYFESVALRNKIAKITAPNDYTVQIYLNEPDSSVLEHLASQYAVILSKEYALQLNADENLAQLDLLPVGTGVYQLKDYVQNEYVRLTPNKKYWGEKAHIANVVVDVSTNSIGRIAKFLNGECDIAALPEPSQQAVVKPQQIVKSDGADLAFLAFNTQHDKMKDATFRHKIAAAINRQRISDKMFYGMAEPAENVLPEVLFPEPNPNSYPYVQPVEIDEEPVEEDELNFWVLDEARVYNLHPLKMAEMIRDDLAKIGVRANIRPVSRAYIVQMAEKGKADYDLVLTGWIANNQDLSAFLNPILSCRTQYEVTNLANWCNDQFDYLLETARLSQSKESKVLQYKLIQSLLEDEMPILPLVNAKRVLFVNERVIKAHVSALGQVRLSQLQLQDKGK